MRFLDSSRYRSFNSNVEDSDWHHAKMIRRLKIPLKLYSSLLSQNSDSETDNFLS